LTRTFDALASVARTRRIADNMMQIYSPTATLSLDKEDSYLVPR